jgi:hypothetical protein
MTHSVRARTRGVIFVSAAISALGAAAACSDDAASPAADPTTVPSPGVDGGEPQARADASDEPLRDAATTVPDAADGSVVVALQGCQLRSGAAFCDDFDDADALKPGKTKWDFVEPTDQPVATLSAVQRVSTPSSLLSRIIDGTTPGAKFAKTVTKASFTEATWEYDVFFENIGTSDGFFLDDFQFSDSAGADAFGFRLVMFSNAGAIGELKVEHNQQATGGPYTIEPPFAAGTVALGKWHHFKQTVKFTFASADAGADAGAGDTAEYTITVDGSATPTFTKKYAGPTRGQATFARIAGVPFVFNKANSTGLKIYWDNHALDLK